MNRLCDYDYVLPPELIAQYPAQQRDASRLLVLDRGRLTIEHRQFRQIIGFFKKGDVLVLNDTKVLPARLVGRRQTGGRVEVLFLRPLDEKRFEALIKPLGRLREGEDILLGDGFHVRLLDAKKKIIGVPKGRTSLLMKKFGQMPLPPYIRRLPERLDQRRYQTVFASRPGAVAAPTAGLHFTRRLLGRLKNKGVRVVPLTLHVNYATFSPVQCDDLSGHRMQEEYFEIPGLTVREIRRAKREHRRVFAVGTTVAKALEDGHDVLLDRRHPTKTICRWSKLFIRPPFTFQVVDALITNFHLPRTTLLMLVSAFAGRDTIRRAYEEAIQQRYRFYSYGDAMLIL